MLPALHRPAPPPWIQFDRRWRTLLWVGLAAALILLPSSRCWAQNSLLSGGDSPPTEDSESSPAAVQLGEAVSFRWRVGVRIATSSSSFRNVLLTIPVPADWPEQSVQVVAENVPIEIGKLVFREGEGNLRQIVTRIDSIPAGKLVEFDITYRVTVREQLPPTDVSGLVKPERPEKEIKEYLGVGPDITFRHAKIRRTVKEIAEGAESDWQQTEAIYDWIREHIENRDGPTQSTIETLQDEQGNAEDIVGLFVAMCRANKVPARMVWVDGHQYAEFYLEDAEGTGRWYPCNLVGPREFGGCSNPRVIQQKGDSLKVPESEDRLKFVPEFVTGKGKSRPQVQFIRDLLPGDGP